MSTFIINAGHTLQGKGTGAVGFLNESKENRAVANHVIKLLKQFWANTCGNSVTNSRNRHTGIPARFPGLQMRLKMGNTKKKSSTSSGSRNR